MRSWSIIEIILFLGVLGVIIWAAVTDVTSKKVSPMAEIVPHGSGARGSPALHRVQDPATGWTCWVAGDTSDPGGIFCADLRTPPVAERIP